MLPCARNSSTCFKHSLFAACCGADMDLRKSVPPDQMSVMLLSIPSNLLCSKCLALPALELRAPCMVYFLSSTDQLHHWAIQFILQQSMSSPCPFPGMYCCYACRLSYYSSVPWSRTSMAPSLCEHKEMSRTNE